MGPYKPGYIVEINMPHERFWHGQRGMITSYERKHSNGYWIETLMVELESSKQEIKVRPTDVKVLTQVHMYDRINKDAEVLPEYVPPKAKPQDGDHISNHKDCEVVTASAGGKAYKYCRTCKIEVSEGPRVIAGSSATLKIGGKEIKGSLDVNLSLSTNPLAGQDLDDVAALHGLTRDFQEGDTLFRQRVLEKARGK